MHSELAGIASPDAEASTGFPVAESLCTVVSNDAVNGEYRLLVLAAPVSAMQGKAGQFFHLLCPASDSGTPYLRRPMSVYRFAKERGQIEFLYKTVGLGTVGMATLRKGDPFNIVGPLGQGFSISDHARNIVVLGRGVGLATLAPLADLAASRNVGVTAILSARSSEFLMSEDRFSALGANIITVTDEDGSSDVGNVAAILRDLHREKKADAFYTCGSNRLLLLMQEIGRDLGIPGEVALEQQMACGLGMCFCCVRSFNVDGETIHRRVCSEGPVFDLQEATGW